MNDVFHIDRETGVLSNNEVMGKYVGGHFDIIVEARSSPGVHNVAIANVKVCLTHIFVSKSMSCYWIECPLKSVIEKVT